MSEKANKGGAPSKCTAELLERAKKYVDKQNFEIIKKKVVTKDGLEEIEVERPNWVSVAGMAIELDVSRASIYNWSNKDHESFNEEFFYIFERMQRKQEFFLEFHGLTRGYDSGFARFLASNLTKYKEKQTIDIDESLKDVIKLKYNVE